MSAEGSFIRFSRRDMAGALVVNVFAVISAVGLMGVALRVAYLAYQNYRHRDAAKSKEFGFFNTQVGYYAICLLISNCMNSVAGLIGITFLVQGGISEDGLLCKTQATVMQFGSLGAAYFTCAIAIHTFNSLVLRRRQSVWVYSIAIIVGWLMAGALATLPLYQKSMRSGAIYGGSGLACGVREVHAQLQFFYHLLPIFVCAVISAILYALIFLVLRGTLVIKGGVRLSLNPHERYGIHLGRYQRFVAGIAKSMLWFPAAYIVLLVPYSVTRLLTIGRFTVPFEATVVAFVCWFMLGIVNVLLLYNTFRVLSPAFSGASSSKGKVSFMPQDMYKTQSEKQSMESTSPFNAPAMIVSPERAISVSSYYNYEGRRADVERQISPVDVLNRGVSDNARYHQQSPSLTSQRHLRESSQDSLLSLPTPPRRRSPIASAAPTPTWMPAVPESASPTRVHRQSFLRLSDQSDRDATSWTTRQHFGGSQPNGQPSISAVNPNFDRSTMRRARHSRNLTSPTAPVRPRRSVDFAADHTRNPSNPPSYI